MNEVQSFRYPRDAIMKDYMQAGAGVLIFGCPLVLYGPNVYVAGVLGAIVLMFAVFGWSAWRRGRSVIVVTDEAIAIEGAGAVGISWPEIERVGLRYFPVRRGRGREGADERGGGWMQLKIEGAGAKIKIDSTLNGFDDVARRVAAAIERHHIATAPATKPNFAALGLAPNAAWAEEV